MIDVGQGDSLLLHWRRTNILIDTGGTFSEKHAVSNFVLLPLFKSLGVKKLNYLILTHGDYDHMGEAMNIINNLKVENVILNCGKFHKLEIDLIQVLKKKQIPYYRCVEELNIEDKKLYFLNHGYDEDENDNSNVIYTELNNYKFLFMGDAGVKVEKDLLEKYNLNNIDVLKVGHHGSKTSSSKEFIEQMHPKYSLISVGKNNRYGHPDKEVLENLQDSIIIRTDQYGSVMFYPKNNTLSIISKKMNIVQKK